MSVLVGVDIGRARIGVAACDAAATIAYPVETVQRGSETDAALRRVAAVCSEHDAERIYVGLPLNLRGAFTPSTADALECAERLAEAVEGEVRLIDERFTTNIAAQQLRPSGRKRQRQRSVIDQAAAVQILQTAIDIEHRTGAPAGMLPSAVVDE